MMRFLDDGGVSRPCALGLCQTVIVALYRRIDRVADRLFEGEEAVFQVMG